MAIIIAASEAVLYLIWSSREAATPTKKRVRRARPLADKKVEDPDTVEVPVKVVTEGDNLRRRKVDGGDASVDGTN